jgi:hypothetical protein
MRVEEKCSACRYAALDLTYAHLMVRDFTEWKVP